MRIVSRFPYLWPHLNFGLAVGDNNIDEADIPLAAHSKLEHLSKPGPKTPTRNDKDEMVFADTPAPISGYEPSAAFVAAAERHNPKRAAARIPKVATMRTVNADPVAPTAADKAVVEKHNADTSRLVEGDRNKHK